MNVSPLFRNKKIKEPTQDEAKVYKKKILITATKNMIGTFCVPITALQLAIREVNTQYVNYLIEFLRALLKNVCDVPFPPASGLVYSPVTSIEELEQVNIKIETFFGNYCLLVCLNFPSQVSSDQVWTI